MAEAACTFHLVRHAQHGLLGHVLAGRMPGVGLSAAGLAEAEALARHFTPGAFRALLASPMLRTAQTAAPIGTATGLAPQTDAGLDEVDFGAWAGRSFAELATEPGWHDWNAARGLAPTPAGETMLAVQARAVGCLAQHRQGGGAVIAVTHSDVVKAVLCHSLGMPLDLMHRIQIDPASRSVLVLGAGFARVEAVNLPP